MEGPSESSQIQVLPEPMSSHLLPDLTSLSARMECFKSP